MSKRSDCGRISRGDSYVTFVVYVSSHRILGTSPHHSQHLSCAVGAFVLGFGYTSVGFLNGAKNPGPRSRKLKLVAVAASWQSFHLKVSKSGFNREMMRAMGLERFNVNKLKPHLKMSEQRIAIVNSKKTNQIKVQKREIAEMLRQGKEEKARIWVESMIRCDFTIEAYELLGLLCELVHERAALVANEKECPADMKEAMCTLIWASHRTEVPELREVARQIELKYGKEFTEEARTGVNECVNMRVAHKLSVAPPSAKIVINYLTAIAKEYDIDWTPADIGLDDDAMATQCMPGPTGFSVQVAPGSNLTQAYEAPPVAEIIGVHPPAQPPAQTPALDPKQASVPIRKQRPPLDSSVVHTVPSAPPGTNDDDAQTLRSDDDTKEEEKEEVAAHDLPPPVGTGPSHDNTNDTDYDALAKRFESLKK